MKVIILAAGEGTRLRPYTNDRPKCLVELAGKSLLQWQVENLRAAGISSITIVTGYLGEKIRLPGIETILNKDYQRTNMLASLFCARGLLDGKEDILISYGDIAYQKSCLELLHGAVPSACTLPINTRWLELWKLRMEDPLSDVETLRFSPEGYLTEIGARPSHLSQVQGQYMGLIRLGASFVKQWVSAYDGLGERTSKMSMTEFLQCLVEQGHKIQVLPIEGGWLEVDSREDLELYRRLYQQGGLSRLWSPE